MKAKYSSKALLNSMSDVLIVLDLDGIVTDFNDAYVRLTGLSREQVIGQLLRIRGMSPAEEETIVQRLKELRSGIAAENSELTYTNNQGKEGTLDVVYDALRDDDGNPTVLFMVLRDITEHRQVEKALLADHQKYRLLVENIPDIVWLHNHEGELIFVSANVYTVLGYTPEEFYAMRASRKWWSAGIHPDDIEAAKKQYEASIDEVRSFSFEYRYRKKDGQWIWLRSKITNSYNQDGASYYQGLTSDITESKQAEQWRQAILDTAIDGFWMSDAQGRILEVNDSYSKMIGYSREELLRMSISDVEAGETPEEITRYIERTMQQGADSFDSRHRCKDGTIIDVEISVNYLHVGEHQQFFIFVRDITQRKQVEEALRASESKFRALFDISPYSTLMCDPEGRISLYNREFIRLHGISESNGKPLGRTLTEFFVEDERPLVAFIVKNLFEANWVQIPHEFTMLREGGVSFLAEVSCTPIYDQAGRPAGILIIAQDITERRQAEEKLRVQSITDKLTGLYNRHYFYAIIDIEIKRSVRNNDVFSLVMIDLDRFKEFNDRFGHTNGDMLLKEFSEAIQAAKRKSDIGFRYGGDEFVLVLPSTSAKQAKNVIGRIKRQWEKIGNRYHADGEPVLFSAGIAEFPSSAETDDGLIFLADAALFQSKRNKDGKAVTSDGMESFSPHRQSIVTAEQVYALAATVDARDSMTYGHSKRVAKLSAALGKEIGLSREYLERVRMAALLHDIGKVGVPDDILKKPGKLNRRELKTVRKHSEEGARIVSHIRELEDLLPSILHHHEWYDGTGYPKGLAREEIPIGARIIAISDAFDTMTSSRSYGEPIPPEQALEELRRCSGTQFDPYIVDGFCRMERPA